MTRVHRPRIDLDKAAEAARLVDLQSGTVARSIYVDEEIYRLELEQIFGRCWLYLAHESQIPKPNDFVKVFMGTESVIVCRDRAGTINAFINSCRHRGSSVCRVDQGNVKTFVCPYHGWTYDTRGELVHVPGEETFYHGAIDRKEWGLPRVAKVASYGGLIFGTFDAGAPSLDDYLGDMRWGLDLLLAQGDLVAVPGIARWVMESNWKFAADNAIGDMYHGAFTHKSAQMAGHKSGTGTTNAKGRTKPREGVTVVTEYGHGFTASYVSEDVDLNSPLAAWRKRPELVERLGPLGPRINRANMNIFPNLFVNSGSRELMIRNPLSPTRMEIWKTVLVDRNADPAVIREHVRASNRHFGPAGMFEMDDGENWDQSTTGALAPINQRYALNYSMGLGRGAVEPAADGHPALVRTLYNEHAQLWLYRTWAEFMRAPDWDYLKANHSRPEGVL
jgi:phenylpropionate dioxygenase-like ring-hydroxylating dioxygenase large terminal subunit